MTEAEVLELVERAVRATTDDERLLQSVGTKANPMELDARATAPYEANGLTFDAYFLFEGGRLECVGLKPKDESQIAAILDALETKYGRADSIEKPFAFAPTWVEYKWFRQDAIHATVMDDNLSLRYCSRQSHDGL
jgi:hypothetical protein